MKKSDYINRWDTENAECMVWEQYRFPNNIIIETCSELGTEVKFDTRYHKSYFKDEAVEDIIQPEGIEKTRRWVEEKIYEDCKKEDWKAVDIFRILAWKTGKINYNKVPKNEPKGIFDFYDKNWEESEKDNRFVSFQIPYQQKVEWNKFEPVSKKIKDIRRIYCENKDAQEAWNKLLALSNDEKYKNIMRGIGVVYLITLFHFITDCEYPIFDRFAMASLVAWRLKSIEKDSVKIIDKTIIRGCSLPSKDTVAAQNILESGIYLDYIYLLKEFCKEKYDKENEWKNNRDVDRALWVFGHFFDVTG